MLTKQRHYFFNSDGIRVPPTQRQRLVRRDGDRLYRVSSNPIGRNSGSVWHILPSNYRGRHDAAFPPELVRRMLTVSCNDFDPDVVVLDPFGGSGTTARVALQHGYRAITIDNDPAATEEARERLASAPANWPSDGAVNQDAVDIDPPLAAD